MNKKRSANKGWWTHLKKFIRTNTSLAVIILAALLLELTTGILYYSAQNIIQQNVERLRKINAEQSDDLTMLAIKYIPACAALARSHSHRHHFPRLCQYHIKRFCNPIIQ